MDFKLANAYAERIARNEGNQELFDELTSMSLSYMFFVRKKFAFQRISKQYIEDHMASEVVSTAVMETGRRSLSYVVCLQNAFRDLCRQRVRIIREHHTQDLLEKCNLKGFPRIGGKHKAPDKKAEDDELYEISIDLLTNHDPFSKKVVLQKTRGATYPEMALIFSTAKDGCKKVYWHDIEHLRNKLEADEND